MPVPIEGLIELPEPLAQRLKNVPLFSDLTDEQRRRLASSATVREYPAGGEVFWAGDPANSFLLVLSGTVKVYLLSPDAREQILHLVGKDALVAEGAVFAQQTYPASAAAVEPSVVAHFYRDRLVELLRQDPELSLGMIAGLSRRLRQFVVTIEDLSLRDVTARLARYIWDNAEDGVCELACTKTQLAAQLGTVLEPLSRALRKLKTSGVIEEEGGAIRVIDEEALEQLAGGP